MQVQYSKASPVSAPGKLMLSHASSVFKGFSWKLFQAHFLPLSPPVNTPSLFLLHFLPEIFSFVLIILFPILKTSYFWSFLRLLSDRFSDYFLQIYFFLLCIWPEKQLSGTFSLLLDTFPYLRFHFYTLPFIYLQVLPVASRKALFKTFELPSTD